MREWKRIGCKDFFSPSSFEYNFLDSKNERLGSGEAKCKSFSGILLISEFWNCRFNRSQHHSHFTGWTKVMKSFKNSMKSIFLRWSAWVVIQRKKQIIWSIFVFRKIDHTSSVVHWIYVLKYLCTSYCKCFSSIFE